jgi:agmatinase
MHFGHNKKEFLEEKNAKIAVIPVTFDETSTWLKGADKGPAALMDASAYLELYDIETNSEVYKKGIFTDKPITEKRSSEAMNAAVEKKVTERIKQGKFVVVLGGEHSISLGSIKAHAKNFKNLTVLQLDAHSDMRDELNNSIYNHGCVMARAKDLVPIVQVGIRSSDISEFKNIKKENIFYAHRIIHSKDWIPKVLNRLSENVYITIDVDVFDIGIMPSTGTPEPGGLSWYHVMDLLKAVAKTKNIVGFDVVELCPSKNRAPDFLAAKLVYQLLSYRFFKEKL